MLTKKKREKYFRKERVRKREDFFRLNHQGSRYHSKQYSIIVVKNNLDYLRLAISIKRSVGNAAVRNYEKRVCREIFRKEKSEFKNGYDILIIVRQQTERFIKSGSLLRNLFVRSMD